MSAYPKKLGPCLDLLLKMDEDFAKVKKAFDAKEKQFNAEYAKLENHIFDTFKKDELNGGVGERAIAEVKRTPIGNVKDWDKFWAFCAKGNWDLLQKRVSQTAFRARLDDKVPVPGTEVFHKVTLDLKPRKKGAKK